MDKEPKISKSDGEKMPSLMSFEEYESRRHPTPYKYRFEKSRKILSYFGAEHSRDPENIQFQQLKQEFSETRPQLVFIEGVDDMASFIRKELEVIKASDEETTIRRLGEKGLAVKLATETGADIQCPEPDDIEIVKDLLKQGFSQEDVFARFMYFYAEQYRGDKPLKERLEKYISGFKQDFAWPDFDFSFKHLKQIWHRLWPDRVNYPDFEFSRIDPARRESNQNVWTAANEISQRTDVFRDEYILKKINEALGKTDRLFIVYGASHAYMQEPALIQIFKDLPD